MFILNISVGYTSPQTVVSPDHDTVEQVSITVELFLSSTCSDCKKADAFFRDLEIKEPWLIVHRYFINNDHSALKLFYERLQQQHSTSFVVPAIFFCDSRWVGFAGEDTSGKALMNGLTYCRQKFIEENELSPSSINVLRQWGNATQFRINLQAQVSPFLLIPLTALVDAVSSCSLFCFIALLAFMWLSPTQKWLQLSVGLSFLLSIGIIHYAQQTESALYYELLPKLRIAIGLVGILLLFYALKDSRKLVARSVWKPDAFIFAVIIFTVFAVYVCQQTCLLNMALVFQQWLTEQTITPTKRIFYEAYYLFFYLLPMALILLFYFCVGRHQRLTKFQRTLQIASCLILMTLGLLLVVYPPLLADLLVSSIVLFVSIVIGWLLVRRGF